MAKKPIGKVSRAIKDKCTETIISLQAFETFWAYYFQSNQQLYVQQVKEAVKMFLHQLDELDEIYPRALDLEEMGENASEHREYFGQFVDELREWSENGHLNVSEGASSLNIKLASFLACLKVHLLRVINLNCFPPIIISYEPYIYSLEMQQWRSHMPHRRGDVSKLHEELSENDSIVLVADIRRSQDLMTYASSPEDFSERLDALLQKGRELLSANDGIFDKFTGDGLIAYFNPAVTGKDRNHVECFISFCRDFISFCEGHFEAWNKTVQKQPHSAPGIAIGADMGKISFNLKTGHLVAVGSSIVWASRLASVAKSGEVAINNFLWTALASEKLDVEERDGVTKSGEEFLARIWHP